MYKLLTNIKFLSHFTILFNPFLLRRKSDNFSPLICSNKALVFDSKIAYYAKNPSIQAYHQWKRGISDNYDFNAEYNSPSDLIGMAYVALLASFPDVSLTLML